MKPTTPLPWKKADGHFQHVTGDDLDYIIHAANAYPKLIEVLRDPMVVYALGYIAEFSGLGGDHTSKDGDKASKARSRIKTLLRRLGEGK